LNISHSHAGKREKILTERVFVLAVGECDVENDHRIEAIATTMMMNETWMKNRFYLEIDTHRSDEEFLEYVTENVHTAQLGRRESLLEIESVAEYSTCLILVLSVCFVGWKQGIVIWNAIRH
jgi:hypothetical protein